MTGKSLTVVRMCRNLSLLVFLCEWFSCGYASKHLVKDVSVPMSIYGMLSCGVGCAVTPFRDKSAK